MIEAVFSITTLIPIWIWLFLPAAITFATMSILKKPKSLTQQASVTTLLTCLALISFYYFDGYLVNHFVSGFDAAGLPNSFTRSGWWLIWDAWPLFVYPLLIILIIGYGGQALFKTIDNNPRQQAPDLTEPVKPTVIGTDHSIIDKIKIEELKTQIEKLESKNRQLLTEYKEKNPHAKSDKFTEEIRILRGELTTLKQEKARADEKLKHAEEELTRTNELVDKLLNEKFQKF